MSPEFVFAAVNHHTKDSGEAPSTEDRHDSRRYYGYFENDHGEQAIFVYDRNTKLGTLRMGDAGWETTYRVIEGGVPGLVLQPPERQWLAACWQAATGDSDPEARAQRTPRVTDADVEAIEAEFEKLRRELGPYMTPDPPPPTPEQMARAEASLAQHDAVMEKLKRFTRPARKVEANSETRGG